MSGLVLLAMCYGWEGYLLSQHHDEGVFLGDERVTFFSDSHQRIDEASSLAKAFKLVPIR